MKRIFLCLIFLSAVPGFSQGTHSLRGEIRNAGGKKVFLYAYFGEKINRIDSVTCDASGHFIFPLGTNVTTGLYRLSTDKDRFLDLVVNKENIEFVCKGDLTADSTEFLSSAENKIYYFCMGFDRKVQSKLELILPIVDFYPQKDGFYTQATQEYERLQRSEKKILDSLTALYPGSFALRIFRLQQTPFLPSGLTKEDRMSYLRQHFLDDVDFTDTLLLHSNAWSNKAISYLSIYSNNKYNQKQLESEFIKAVTVILSKAAVNAEIYKFLLDYFVGGFDKYHFDAVITYIADNFQDPFSCEDQARKTKLQKKLENFKKISVGKTAPDISVPDMKGKLIRLSEIKSEYTLLVFWSSECGHCIQMMPQLKALYDKQKPKRWEVMTVSLDTSRTEWTTFIKEQNLTWLNGSEMKGFNSVSSDEYNIFATPTMFLLDREKKILAKPISYRELEEDLRENRIN
ncbi:MAG: redoxin domain-containing protein [Bacteroidetes bacterium]|nr:redoxin domain-containing protein [Bacteroidota bacterium]